MKFTLGKQRDPGDTKNNLLRDIAGSLAVNADSRERLFGTGGEFVVRDVSVEIANRLREADVKIFVRLHTIDPIVSGAEEKFKSRLARERASGDPDWNVIRKDDTRIYSQDELGAIYDEVTREVKEVE